MKEMTTDQRKIFDEWWDKNEKQFLADSCHMSEYHMASVCWNAAIDRHEKDSDRLQYILRFVWFYSVGGPSYCIVLDHENDQPVPNASTDLLNRVDAALSQAKESSHD
jgi:hypothetical protein